MNEAREELNKTKSVFHHVASPKVVRAAARLRIAFDSAVVAFPSRAIAPVILESSDRPIHRLSTTTKSLAMRFANAAIEYESDQIRTKLHFGGLGKCFSRRPS